MESHRSLPFLFMFVIGLVGIFVLANYLVSHHSVPSLSEYMASSTEPTASATSTDVSATDANASEDSSSTALILPTANVSPSPSPSSTPAAGLSGILTALRAPKGIIRIKIATSTADQEQGLGDLASLPASEGMLFSFVNPGSYAFWMKDMEFPLDMVWINYDKTVAGVTSNIPADTYPETYVPPHNILYVLEVNAGAAGKFGIATGTTLVF